ncbi:MAG: heavy metal translocating P-type ATPase, partial [bacterium]
MSASHTHEDASHRRRLALTALVAAGLAVYLTGALRSVYGFDLALLLTLVGGYPIFSEAVLGLAKRRISADLAVSLAAIAALVIGQYAVAAEVVLIMLIGEALEHFAVGRTRSAIAELLELRPQTARVRRDGHEQVVPVEEIRADDTVLVRPGERIPVDGQVAAGSSSVDQSPITGESLPADKAPGDEVFAGTINQHGALELAVERLGEDTALERIIRLVEEAEEAKAPSQRLADRYATWFVPVVIAVALVTWLVTREPVRAVSVLVVACPCALVLATPTAIAAGIGALVRRGILVKGGAALEALGRVKAVIFDKTGTLTRATLRMREVVAAPGIDEAEVLRVAASVERHSEHAIGQLVVARAEEEGVEPLAVEDFLAHPGLGVSASADGDVLRMGNRRFLEQAQVAVPEALAERVEALSEAGCTVSLVARGGEAIGAVAVEDTIRAEAQATVQRLHELGISHIVMLTGDNEAAARAVADRLGIDDPRSSLLPDDKVAAVRAIQRDARPVAMVGDGVNDAPSLVTADVGIAMADIGTDVAVASADVVLVGDDLRKLADAVAMGRRALRTVWQNILGFALVFNAVAVVVASLGWIGPVVAAVLHQVSSLVVCLNSLRLLFDRERWRARLAGAWGGVVRRRWRIAGAGAGLALAAWLLSGVHVVRVGEVGVVQRFGQVVTPVEGPGLHVRLPWPFGRHRRVRQAEARRVEIGFRTVPGAFAEPPAYEWNVQHRGGRYQRVEPEAVVWTGDENLVDVNLVVQYRVSEPLTALFTLGDRLPDGASKWDTVVRDLTEAALRAEMAARPINAILGPHRGEVQDAILRRVA